MTGIWKASGVRTIPIAFQNPVVERKKLFETLYIRVWALIVGGDAVY